VPPSIIPLGTISFPLLPHRAQRDASFPVLGTCQARQEGAAATATAERKSPGPVIFPARISPSLTTNNTTLHHPLSLFSVSVAHLTSHPEFDLIRQHINWEFDIRNPFPSQSSSYNPVAHLIYNLNFGWAFASPRLFTPNAVSLPCPLVDPPSIPPCAQPARPSNQFPSLSSLLPIVPPATLILNSELVRANHCDRKPSDCRARRRLDDIITSTNPDLGSK
jgi:hypothetical protein